MKDIFLCDLIPPIYNLLICSLELFLNKNGNLLDTDTTDQHGFFVTTQASAFPPAPRPRGRGAG